MRQKSVYLIENVDTGHVKIGVSHNPARRLARLQTGNPYRLILRFVLVSEEATRLEARLHQRFADRRVHGEWFNVEAVDVARLAAGWPGVIGVEQIADRPAPEPPPAPAVKAEPDYLSRALWRGFWVCMALSCYASVRIMFPQSYDSELTPLLWVFVQVSGALGAVGFAFLMNTYKRE